MRWKKSRPFNKDQNRWIKLFLCFWKGFFVAVLYCFLNGEVRTEVSRTLRSIKRTHLHGIQWGSRPSTHSVSTCSCNNVSKSGGRHSRKSKWWKSRWKTNPCLFHDRAIRQSTHSMASTQGVPLNPTKHHVPRLVCLVLVKSTVPKVPIVSLLDFILIFLYLSSIK